MNPTFWDFLIPLIVLRLRIDGHNRVKSKSTKANLNCIKESIYIDLGESGTHFKRKGFLRLMEDVRAGKVNCIIVKDFSRFGRDYIEVGNYLDHIFPFLGVRFISVTDHFDSYDKEENEMDRNLKNLMNEMYVKDTAKKVYAIKKLYREHGNYIGGRAPYGYQIERKEGKRILTVDQAAFEVVEKIWQLHLGGKSQGEIAAWLYQNRIYRPSDYRRIGRIYGREGEEVLEWQKGSIWQILSYYNAFHQLHTGIVQQSGREEKRQNKKKQNERDPNEKNQKEKSQEKNDPNKENQKEKDQKKNGRNKKKQNEQDQKKNTYRNVWKGMMICGDCKHMLSCRREPNQTIYYCGWARRMDHLQCKKKRITEETVSACIVLLVQLVFQKEKGFIGTCGGDRKALEEFSLERANQGIEKLRRQMERMDMQVGAAKRMVSERYMEYQSGKIDRETFLLKKAVEQEKRKRLIREKEKKLQQIQMMKQMLEKRMVWIGMLAEGEMAWLRDADMISCLVKQIELFCGKRMVIRFRIRREVFGSYLHNTIE